ncbi:hypothetical protein OAB20_03225 [Winogradskyella sp.]|nr:hypothetical protein [Winogradskyella sp.]
MIDGSELSIFEATNLNIKREIIDLTETTLIIKVFEEDANIINVFGEFEYEH